MHGVLQVRIVFKCTFFFPFFPPFFISGLVSLFSYHRYKSHVDRVNVVYQYTLH